MIKKAIVLLIFSSYLLVFGQAYAQKIPLNHDAYKIWKKIERPQISNDGKWTTYILAPGEGDATLILHDNEQNIDYTFARGYEAQISNDNQYVIFKIKPFADSIKAMRRRKIKEPDLTKDTLTIYQLKDKKLVKIPNVKSYKMPTKWSGALAFLREAEKEPKKTEPDTSKKTIAVKKKKEENKDNGYRLSLRNLATSTETNFDYIKEFTFADEARQLLLATSGSDSLWKAGVYLVNPDDAKTQALMQVKKGTFKNINISKSGKYASFIADIDTTKAKIRPFGLYLYQAGDASAKKIFDAQNSDMPKGWIISEATYNINKNETRLRFYVSPEPILQDSTLLPEEIVHVEVWNYKDPKLYTQQVKELDEYKKRAYPVVYDLLTGKHTFVVRDDSSKTFGYNNDFNGDYEIIIDDFAYRQHSSWLGYTAQDIYVKNIKTDILTKVKTNTDGTVYMSPAGKFIFWYCPQDSTWFVNNLEKQQTYSLRSLITTPFYDELHDVPSSPNTYGFAGWTKDDKRFLVYDKNDIWSFSSDFASPATNITKGRERNTTYRYIKLNNERNYIETEEKILLHSINEKTFGEGLAWYDLKTNQLQSAYFEPDMAISQRVLKAKNVDRFIFTKENFKTFPNIQYTDNQLFKAEIRISDANPQQAKYTWGTSEIYTWTAADGQKLSGMLFKPEGFDTKQKYPMIVNYYERSVQGINQHRIPEPLRSSINYSFYASRGYVIFNPDVVYRTGYPGESAMSAVMSGVTSLIDKGFIDAKNIGIQGHSWGGYQTAYIVTKTNLFKCAEAGAPVVNMTSAYGGIRWESGLVREFQYEHGQSRIGGSLWEYPMRYLENSPIFNADKINTPLLILHNDKDGAVPWYQGIELFTAMRRLQKPAWMLNYNDEPHWPVKWQNRVDFNIRMQEFFDHYLKGEPMPDWMKKGVPAIEKYGSRK